MASATRRSTRITVSCGDLSEGPEFVSRATARTRSSRRSRAHAASPGQRRSIVALNHGPLDAEPPAPAILDARDLVEAVAAGATVLDMRSLAEFAAAHLSGALVLGTGAARTTRVCWAVEPDEQLIVVDRDVPGARPLPTGCTRPGCGPWRCQRQRPGVLARWRSSSRRVRAPRSEPASYHVPETATSCVFRSGGIPDLPARACGWRQPRDAVGAPPRLGA